MESNHGNISVIGLGVMGAAMARNLIRSGWRVAGCDLDPANLRTLAMSGGKPCKTPAQAASGTTALLLMVSEAAAVDTVLFGENGAAYVLKPDSVVWLGSTVSPRYARELDDRLRPYGVSVVDGPVSGGMLGAESAQLTVLAGGQPKSLDKVMPLMRACAAHVYRVGDVGAGSTFKAVNQLLTAAHIAVTAEALALAKRVQLDTEVLIQVIGQSAGNSYQFEKRAPRIVGGDHSRHATVNLFRKDLAIALEIAAELNLPLPLGATVHQLFTMAAGLGYGNESDTRIMSVYDTLTDSSSKGS